MPPARSVIIGPSGRAVVRYGPVDSGAGQTLGYLVNLPVFARLVYSRLQDQGPFLEVLLPSGTVIATAGDPLPVGTACTVANLPLDDWLKGCVLRLTTSDTEVSHTVRRYAIVRISMLIGMVGLAGIGLITLWVGISRQMELTRLKSEFIANVSHELKTPLALIRIIGESLRLGRVADEGKRIHYYEVLAKESHRLTTLINNVLDFSRIDQGRKEYQRDLHQPRAIAEPIFDAYTMHLQKSGFITRFEAPDDLPKVLLDPEGYAQVLVNLIDNAEKFSDTVKDITVRLAVQDDIFLTEVADRGIGIPPEEASRIFERFYRARSAVKRQIRGTGIGLNLAQHVAEAHGGRLQVSPREGGGTVFRLAIPL